MSELRFTIILIEDEDQIRRFIRLALEAEGCRVYEATTVRRGLIEAATHKPDLVILDLGLQDADGTDFIRDFRSWSEIPVIVLSARSAEFDKIAALDTGADDYLTKPFGTGELLARVRAQLRRRARTGEQGLSEITFGDVHVDLVNRVVVRDGRQVPLTQIEYRLIALLICNAGKVLTQRQILQAVWGPSHIEENHYPRVYIGRLRQKLERDAGRPEFILTETGVGYRFAL